MPAQSSAPVPTSTLDPEIAARLKRDPAGLVAAIVQQHDTREVLMLGWMDDEALSRTLTEGRVTFYSRSRQEYWRKGDTSGHVQWVRSVSIDCDGDALLVEVDQVGAACHTGERTCFISGGDLGAVVASAAEPTAADRSTDHHAGLSTDQPADRTTDLSTPAAAEQTAPGRPDSKETSA
ncbi:phosphoribosyl-AMP cyclohydrolase [Sanguibacter inulinus]|uniref:Phosphoribosyl-AMP cyclohydrolase n=1 Tax=Sanguibacter inulinus TaxID=60922 RepID=A0A853ERB8_9MICO|nr:phosphoribosyl-AMP cyclohydrolase [Sanguibacter inulinus]NYS92947.1 phosphoribosyl-AMP cyclohydrolase [Sanguibacter inulinus]